MDLKELLEDVPRGIKIAWAICAVFSMALSGLIMWALIKYIGS